MVLCNPRYRTRREPSRLVRYLRQNNRVVIGRQAEDDMAVVAQCSNLTCALSSHGNPGTPEELEDAKATSEIHESTAMELLLVSSRLKRCLVRANLELARCLVERRFLYRGGRAFLFESCISTAVAVQQQQLSLTCCLSRCFETMFLWLRRVARSVNAWARCRTPSPMFVH